MLRQSDFSLFFVIDPPALLLDSVILVSTARYHLPDVELVAYCPDAKREFVPEFLKELYSSLNVDLSRGENRKASGRVSTQCSTWTCLMNV